MNQSEFTFIVMSIKFHEFCIQIPSLNYHFDDLFIARSLIVVNSDPYDKTKKMNENYFSFSL